MCCTMPDMTETNHSEILADHVWTAVKKWNRPRTKATVVILCDGEVWHSLGGNRAARAEAVLLFQSNEYRYVRDAEGNQMLDENRHPVTETTGTRIRTDGLRGDLFKAQQEAERGCRTREVRSSRYGNYTHQGRPTIAVQVTEEVVA